MEIIAIGSHGLIVICVFVIRVRINQDVVLTTKLAFENPQLLLNGWIELGIYKWLEKQEVVQFTKKNMCFF